MAGAGALYRESGRQGEKKRTRKTPADEPRGWPGEASGRRGGSKGGGATSVDWGATRSDELRCRPYFTAPCPPPHPLRRPALRNARRTQRGPYPRQAGAEGGAAGSPCCKREVTPLPQRRRRAGAKGHRGRRACRPERPLHAARWGPDPTRRVTPQCSLLQGLRGRDVLPLADVHPPQTAPAGTCRSIVPNQPAKVRQPIPNQPAKGMLRQTEGGGESAAVCSHSPPSPGLPGHPTRLIRDTWSDVTDHHHLSRTFPIEKTTMRDGKISNVFDVDGTETSRVCFSFTCDASRVRPNVPLESDYLSFTPPAVAATPRAPPAPSAPPPPAPPEAAAAPPPPGSPQTQTPQPPPPARPRGR